MGTLTLDGTPIRLEPHLEVYALCAALLLAYFGLVRRYGPLFHPRPGERAVTRWQATSFVSGVAVLWIAAGSPLHDISEQALYSAHTIVHLLEGLVFPALILAGLPEWMFELLTRPPKVRATVRFLGKPLVGAALFNGVMLLIHWPNVVDAMLRSEFFHSASHQLWILASFAMWLPVLSPSEAIVPRLAELPRLFYLFIQTLVPTIPSAFLTFGTEPLYAVYATFPRVWLDAVTDMQVAGLLMKVGGGMYLWVIITVLYFRWSSAEERRARAERRALVTGPVA
ncbi:MAG: cytochrome c oxidase assembly protein [Nitriliruptorales bacterium]|nr:cytochrome c oxidase assembly protein [Nitriliruptorales bacterium]